MAQPDRCDEEEGRACEEWTGYDLHEDLRDKKQRLKKKVRKTKQFLEARIMKERGDFEYANNAQISVVGELHVIVG